MISRGKDHGRAMEPAGCTVGHHRVVWNHEVKAGQPQVEPIGQLCSVKDAAHRADQQPIGHPPRELAG
jgi:hypothetical protein